VNRIRLLDQRVRDADCVTRQYSGARPGGYRFSDFFRIGVALQVVVLIITLVVVPLVLPF
jgi:hypothetical protein